MNEYQNEISKMAWSYSRATTYEQCPYEWYLRYIVCDDDEYPEEPNFYAQVGSFVHMILEKIYSGKMKPEDAFDYYVDNFDENVTASVADSIMDKTFDACADYLMDTEAINKLKSLEIVGVEQKVSFKIGDCKFVGFIDLLLRDPIDGKLIIVDHKSSAYPLNKNGTVKANAKSFEKYKKQLYLYAHWVNEIYGEFPKALAWNHFKDGGKIMIIPFNEDEYTEAIDWFVNTINVILSDDEFEPKKEFFYCNNLCAYRKVCEYRQEEDEQ